MVVGNQNDVRGLGSLGQKPACLVQIAGADLNIIASLGKMYADGLGISGHRCVDAAKNKHELYGRKQTAKTSLREVTIGSECIHDAAVLHHNDAGTINESPGFVFYLVVQCKRSLE